MIPVAAYCRVSTDSRDQLNSFENQQSYFRRELSKNPDYRLTRIYADRGISGTSLHREQFEKMLEDSGLDITEVKSESGAIKYVTTVSARSPKFKIIFAKNTSRFARNVEIESIFRDLAKKGVYVYFIDLQKSTESDADRTLLQIIAAMDERESRDRRTKVMFGIAEGDKKGVIRTNGKIFGYKYIQKENRLEIIPEEAEIVKIIFEKYSEGLGIRQIINYLDEHGYKTRQGKSFCKTAIGRILDNEKYTGNRNNCKHSLGNDLFDKFTYPHRKPDGSYIIEETSKIPAIIPFELFEKCRDIRNSRINTIIQKGVRKPSTKFAGVITCGKCFSAYIRNCDRGRYFYECKNKKMHGVSSCDNRNFSQKEIELEIEKFYNTHKELTSDSQYILSRSNRWYALMLAIIRADDFNETAMQELHDKEKAITERLDALYDLYSQKEGYTDFLKGKIEKEESGLIAVKAKILQLETDNEYIFDRIRYCLDKIRKIESLCCQFNSPDDLIPYINIIAGPSNLSIYFNFDIDDFEIIRSVIYEIYGADYAFSNPSKIAYIDKLYKEAYRDIDATKTALKGILERLDIVL